MRHWAVYVRLVALLLMVSFSGSVYAAAPRTGAWVDEVVVTEEPSAAAAITRLEAGELDVYAFGISDPAIYQRILSSPRLGFERSFGSYTELTFNPAGPVFENGKLNPFAVPRIREAMNWLIDRDYIAQEIHGGLAVPRYFPITNAFPDYARLADVMRRLELEYAHNPEKARAIITEEMNKLGARLVGGKWHYQGEPVQLILLIRTEDERRQIGDYVATLLEGLGFTVERQYKTAAEASPIWIGSEPSKGLFHIYTGGWVTTVVARDQASNFNFFYTPRGLARPLWQAYKPEPEFDEVADRLARRDFKTLEERRQLFARAAELAMKDSVRVWLVDRISASPRRAEVSVAADLAGGVYGSYLWGYTIRFKDRVGGTMRVAMPSILTDPWNPLDGTNWIYDMMLIRATADYGFMWDPFTGLHWPQRVERAEVYVKEGLPVGKTLDWVDLRFVPEIRVPADAWIDWDPVAQRFITVGEKHPEGLTANRKTVVYYPKDLSRVRWHDGSPFSVADMVMGLILTFDRPNEKSAVHDPAKKPEFESFQRTFRGMRIVQQDPLVIETYSDLYYLDAEWYVGTWFPYYDFGPGPWHTLTLGLLSEMDQKTAFSRDKARKLEIEWLNMVSGPTVAILEEYLRKASQQNYIPYAPTLQQFVSSEEARQRWQNLTAWYQQKRHFWVGSGPFYLERAYPVEKTVHLKRFADYPDPADKWARFGEPMVADVDVTGPSRVTIGSRAVFDVSVSFKGDPYPAEFMDEVKYLVIDARGQVALVGTAQAAGTGLWRIALSEQDTRGLPSGSNRLEVIAVPRVVSIPTFESVPFVTVR